MKRKTLEEILFETKSIQLIPLDDKIIKEKYIDNNACFCFVKVKTQEYGLDTLKIKRIYELTKDEQGLVFILRDSANKIICASLQEKENPLLVLPDEVIEYLSFYFDDGKTNFDWDKMIMYVSYTHVKDILLENRLEFYRECKQNDGLLRMLRMN
jgi:hypothetical protein